MTEKTKNHSIGKKGETKTWPFLQKNGFVRVSKEQRKEIFEYYENKNVLIEKSGYDVIKDSDIENIGKKDITLYEVKTTGKERGKFIGDDFSTFGFTLSGKEKRNADILKNKYKFIFVNLNKKHLEYVF
jgi:hypothetical protein